MLSKKIHYISNMYLITGENIELYRKSRWKSKKMLTVILSMDTVWNSVYFLLSCLMFFLAFSKFYTMHVH